MEVIEGTGGIMALTDEDKVEIKKTLEDEVLQPGPVEFSRRGSPRQMTARIEVTGELSMNGNVHPLDFELELRTRRSGIRPSHGEAVGLGHRALLRAVRDPQGQG